MKNLLSKLDKINFNNYSDSKLTSDDGWSVSYYVKVQETFGITDSIFQIVVRLTYNDVYVTSYGCVTNEETNEFGVWFVRMKGKCYTRESNNRTKAEKLGKALFDNL